MNSTPCTPAARAVFWSTVVTWTRRAVVPELTADSSTGDDPARTRGIVRRVDAEPAAA
ncbi:hypothetical protein AB0945_27915 [Streptomyces sp. NPDC005474]|uniref:hypothetical protein n=1 Tax=Streptomyces sp. NPDC005474 TaxID=3154878 RepID=UPI00345280E0